MAAFARGTRREDVRRAVPKCPAVPRRCLERGRSSNGDVPRFPPPEGKRSDCSASNLPFAPPGKRHKAFPHRTHSGQARRKVDCRGHRQDARHFGGQRPPDFRAQSFHERPIYDPPSSETRVWNGANLGVCSKVQFFSLLPGPCFRKLPRKAPAHMQSQNRHPRTKA